MLFRDGRYSQDQSTGRTVTVYVYVCLACVLVCVV